MKSFHNAINDTPAAPIKKKQQQQQKQQTQILERIHLEQDEFTGQKTIKHLLIDFVQDAQALETHYKAHKKQMIRTVALKIEDELKRIGKPKLICHISEELMKILKQVGIKWSPIYLRRCLDERYKDPVNRMNALARKRYPGVPEDTGKSVEELEKSLNRMKPPAGIFIVKYNLVHEGKETIKPIVTSVQTRPDGDVDGGRWYKSHIPLIVNVNAAQQEVIISVDWDAYDSLKAKAS